MTTLRPAWVCAPGVQRLSNLAAFLPEYDLRRMMSTDTQAVLGWGLKPSSAAGRMIAEKANIRYVALEDGFLRSVGLGEAGATSLSLVVDPVGIYYDATRPSKLEVLIDEARNWMGTALRQRSRILINRIVESGVSKTNMGWPLDRSILKPGERVLVVDQTAGDASIEYGMADASSFSTMLAAAKRNHPNAQIIVKRHPAVAAGLKQGCIPTGELEGCTVLDDDIRPADLLAEVQAVYVVTSGLGFEALLRGLPVHCFGVPFYSGWGLTKDAVTVSRRGKKRDIEQIVGAALIRYSRYVDPVTGKSCAPEDALERLIALRDRADRLSGYWAATGFAPAKQAAVRRLMNTPHGRIDYVGNPARAARTIATRPDGHLLWWAGKETQATLQAASTVPDKAIRMEDGFIRSRGLGSDFVAAQSVALDDLGVYYDASRPSRLEVLLETTENTPPRRARARDLRRQIVKSGLSKYNLDGARPPVWPSRRDRILVVGQVENDKSIEKGCGDIRTNAALVAAVRAAHPDALIVYRNHPDVLAGNRPGKLDAKATGMVDDIADGLDINACIEGTDAVATRTSLTGFAALLRGKRVLTWGRPFYAGWGLTEDALDFPRRTRRLTIDDLVLGALIDYPIYVAPNGWPCEAEDLVAALIEARATPPPVPPANQLARWWRGMMASLDRTLPPAY